MAAREVTTLDSDSVGDPARFRTLEQLVAGLENLRTPLRDFGTVALIVRRGERGQRETPERVLLTPEEGVPGDSWNRKQNATAESQITVMQTDVAESIANGQPLSLFGDNLFLDLDLSKRNLTSGSRVRIGRAVLEVTPKLHKGCRKFSGRFGAEALRFVTDPETRFRSLRGIYMRVVEAGVVGPGDPVEVMSRSCP